MHPGFMLFDENIVIANTMLYEGMDAYAIMSSAQCIHFEIDNNYLARTSL